MNSRGIEIHFLLHQRVFFLPLRNNSLQECQGRIISPGVGNVLVTVVRAQRIGEENEKECMSIQWFVTIVSKYFTTGNSYRMVFFPLFLHIFWLSSARRFRNNSAASVVMMAASFCTIGISGSSFIAYSMSKAFVPKSNKIKPEQG